MTHRAVRSGIRPGEGVKLGFIPAKGHQRPNISDFEARSRVAAQAAVRRAKRNTSRTFDHATDRLGKMNVVRAIDAIKRQSRKDKDVWLAAEMLGTSRATILDAFPKPSPEVWDLIGKENPDLPKSKVEKED